MGRELDPQRTILDFVAMIFKNARRSFVEQIRTQPTWDRFDVVEAWEKAEEKALQGLKDILEGQPAVPEGSLKPQTDGPPRCPVCSREVPITPDGRLARHIDEASYRVCKGSGQAAPMSH